MNIHRPCQFIAAKGFIFLFTMQKKNTFLLIICIFLVLSSCHKKIDTSKLKGTWKSSAGTVTIEDSTMSYPGDLKKHLYKLENDSTLVIYFDMDTVIRAAEVSIKKLDADSLVIDNDYITRYVRVK